MEIYRTPYHLTDSNLSILKTGKAKAVRISTLDSLCREREYQPGDLLEYEPAERYSEIKEDTEHE